VTLPDRPVLRAHAALAVMVVAWSGAFVGVKTALNSGISTTDLAVLRWLVAAPLFGLLLRRARPTTIGRGGWLRLAIGGVLGVAVYQLAINAGADRIPAGTTSLVVASSPVLTLCLAVAAGQERLTGTKLAGIVLAFVGVAVVSQSHGLGSSGVAGSVLVLVGAASWAAYTVLMKPLLVGRDAAWLTAASGLIGTASLLVVARSSTLTAALSLSLAQAALVVYLAVVVTFVGYVAWNLGVRGVDPSVAAVYLYPITPLSLVLASLLLGERLTASLLIGGGMVVVGCVAATRRAIPEPAP
jgi:drug/metabolite transporter (DMT)-like permease